MKIEKLNDNQIRCTLTRQDLEQRSIKLSELAYGTEKAQALFSEMIRYASYQFGFEVDDSPLMVEAIPISSETIVLIVTKVDYPEELDTRFSRFSKSPLEGVLPLSEMDSVVDGTWPGAGGNSKSHSARDIIDAAISEDPDSKSKEDFSDEEKDEASANLLLDDRAEAFTRIYSFSSIDELFSLSHVLLGVIRSDNTLYHIKGDAYYLVLRADGHTASEYNKICNIVSEYGILRTIPGGAATYFGEHRRPVLKHNALQQLAML